MKNQNAFATVAAAVVVSTLTIHFIFTMYTWCTLYSTHSVFKDIHIYAVYSYVEYSIAFNRNNRFQFILCEYLYSIFYI